MKILLINLYSTPEKFKKKAENFKKIFKSLKIKTKLIIKNWQDKSGIINEINKGLINGIILSGSNFRIKKIKGIIPEEVFKSKIKILGICYGFQYLVYYYSSQKNIKSFKQKSYNKYDKLLKVNEPFKIRKTNYRFNHHDYISKVPKNWKISIKNKKVIYMSYDNNGNIGIQFHPEIYKKSSKLFFNAWLIFISKHYNSSFDKFL
jgi:GMP synthase-like glutamine amidotransferase